MELTLTEFVVAVLVSAFLLAGGFMLISRMLRANEVRRLSAGRIICRLCLHPYRVEGREKIQPCPRCGAANERGQGRYMG